MPEPQSPAGLPPPISPNKYLTKRYEIEKNICKQCYFGKLPEEDLEKILLISTEKCQASKDMIKALLAAYLAGVAQLWSYWSTDFANIGAQIGYVDVPWLFKHTYFTPEQWMGLAVGSSILAAGLTIYASYKIGKAIKQHRLLKDSYDEILKKLGVEIKSKDESYCEKNSLECKIKTYFHNLNKKLKEKEEKAAKWFDKNSGKIAKYAIPIGLLSYSFFEGIIVGSWFEYKYHFAHTSFDPGIWWNNAATGAIFSLILTSLGYVAKGIHNYRQKPSEIKADLKTDFRKRPREDLNPRPPA